MATPQEKLADALEALRALQSGGVTAIRASQLRSAQLRLLLAQGFLRRVMRGWYIASRPEAHIGREDWHTAFWPFCIDYLNARFGERWSLSPEQSLSLHAGNASVPAQLLVRASKGRNKPTPLAQGASIMELRTELTPSEHTELDTGLRVYSLPAALLAVPPPFYKRNPTDARIALSQVRDAADILAPLLDAGRSKVAGRLAGAFRNIGQHEMAEQILANMRAAGYQVSPLDPFEQPAPVALRLREPSPYCNRLRLMWQQMRQTVIDRFPMPSERPFDPDAFLARMDELYTEDAYHSLSIEAYRVNNALIERVRSGGWNPDGVASDRDARDALAARGYWQAFQAMKRSVAQVLPGASSGQGLAAGKTAESDHHEWHRELFAPAVVAGILTPVDLAGYRNDQVYLRGSLHTPPNKEAVRDCMPVFFELLKAEPSAAVRAVLGHFLFVYIHPYMDGNGRLARLLMNLMLASGGYAWLVVPVQQRSEYMNALEAASVGGDIGPFAAFLGDLARQAE